MALDSITNVVADTPAQTGGGTVLILTTTWWAFPARLAAEFARSGCRVEAVAPAGHPLRKVAGVARLRQYQALRPLASLQRAIQSAAPDLIIPCDDRVVEHLHRLYAADPDGLAGQAIMRSLGDPTHYKTVLDRARFIRLARAAGVRAPEMIPVPAARDLPAALRRVGLPAVLKADGTWGGLGTRIVGSLEEAQAAFRAAARPLATARMLKRLSVDRDPFHILPWLGRARASCGVQAFVRGRPANCIAACRNGAVLSLICVEVLASSSPLGAATIVRVIDHPAMSEAARRLTRMLGLSGFAGFDFLIDDASGDAHLLEINPRCTPLAHLNLGAGRDLVGAMAREMSGVDVQRAPGRAADIVAYFPQAWHKDSSNPLLRHAFQDVPWEDPALMRELMRPARPDRGILARLVRALRGKRLMTVTPVRRVLSALAPARSAPLNSAQLRA